MNTFSEKGIEINENGIIQGFFNGQQDRVDELNHRIQSRQFPDNALRPNFDPRPVPTKYAIFPIMDRRTPANYPIEPYLDDYGFSPATQNGPAKPYLQDIDIETILRNQTVALQRGATQGVFVPSSKSDLYRTSLPPPSIEITQPFPNLFNSSSFSNPASNVVSNQPIGKSTFFNHTRVQLRNTIEMPV
jgi:hypothetical protein